MNRNLKLRKELPLELLEGQFLKGGFLSEV